MNVPCYDEFLVYTTKDDMLFFMESVIKETGITNSEFLKNKCMEHFGLHYEDVIMDILEEYEYL